MAVSSPARDSLVRYLSDTDSTRLSKEREKKGLLETNESSSAWERRLEDPQSQAGTNE
ncbi:hypothetical protein EYZ11_006550 [Aspergillus tanneri]|uniref:Uncharacterized protein n=1 Tax=Aspergillus tanneri TaxID=1220188 RepID=A0A4S3JF76_9EURO|nr:hypothetical protein EYZ11_006550 [Aspergillus tanneri]